MSYIHNCIHRVTPSKEDKKGVFEKSTHVSIEGKKFNKQLVALAMSQISGFWTPHNLRPFLHSVSKVTALGVVISLTSVLATFAIAVEPETTKPDLTFSGLIYPLPVDSPTKGVEAEASSNVGFVYDFIDAADNASQATWYYLNNSSTTKNLNVDVTDQFPIPNANNKGIENYYRFYIAAGLRTLSVNTIDEDGPYGWQLQKGNPSYVEDAGVKYYLAAKPDDPRTFFSNGASGYSLNLTLEKNASISTKLHGARNDLYGEGTATDGQPIGAANSNSVNIIFNEGSTLFSQIIFGGRSAQRESAHANTGSQTNYNQVTLKGASLKTTNAFLKNNPSEGEAEMIMRAGIWGAEGWETNYNYVRVENVTLVAQDTTLPHWGIVGGRGYFQNRMNLDPKTQGQSSISNNNIVVIKNSLIGFQNPYKAWDSGSNSLTQNGQMSTNVYGGYSVGIGANNAAILEDVQINGNVYGGFELQNKMKGEAGTPEAVRELNPNLVSLHNVKIAEGHSFYGSATADLYNGDIPSNFRDNTDTTDFNGNQHDYSWLNDDQVVFNEGQLFPVNRRRGVAYLAGHVESDSAYVRYIHFGQYYDDQISPGTAISLAKSYYPPPYLRAGGFDSN